MDKILGLSIFHSRFGNRLDANFAPEFKDTGAFLSDWFYKNKFFFKIDILALSNIVFSSQLPHLINRVFGNFMNICHVMAIIIDKRYILKNAGISRDKKNIFEQVFKGKHLLKCHFKSNVEKTENFMNFFTVLYFKFIDLEKDIILVERAREKN